MKTLPMIRYRLFQSTHPRRVRRGRRWTQRSGGPVSIHAPAKGATFDRLAPYLIDRVSIHAPAKGATSHFAVILSSFTSFNPRTREGCDKMYLHHLAYLGVSIHAPAKGATRHRRGRRRCTAVSIHAPAKGATSFFSQEVLTCLVSIHAPAKGATAALLWLRLWAAKFQSTHPRRVRRLKWLADYLTRRVSIHAPAKGATEQDDDVGTGDAVSIHAPAKGAT